MTPDWSLDRCETTPSGPEAIDGKTMLWSGPSDFATVGGVLGSQAAWGDAYLTPQSMAAPSKA